MTFTSIRKKLSTIPTYIKGNRLGYGLRLFLRKSFRVPVVIKTIRGAYVFLGSDQIDDIILKDLNGGLACVYFPPELDLSKDDVVWDVGGHHGIFAMELAAVYPESQIFSFEPDKNSGRYFKFNQFLNGNVKVNLVEAALDISSHSAYIVKSEEGSWGNFVQNEAIENADRIKTKSVTEILDFYAIKQIKYVKFNAEGAEFVVLPELFRLKVYPELILLFAHPEKGNVEELVIFIQNQSYSLIRVNNIGKRPWFLFKQLKAFIL